VLSTDPTLSSRLKKLGLRADDFDEQFARSGGPGGQHVNKVSTAVTLIYRPSGISVTSQETSSQHRNRRLAAHKLVELIEQEQKRLAAEQRSAIERRRRRNSPRPQTLRREIRKAKEHRSEIKQQRQRVENDA
jgi:protein subunit release factor B